LERAARRVDACDEIIGIDASPVSVETARREADREGLSGIEYRVGDLESLKLPRRHFDAVFFHHSLHHVRSVERLLLEVDRALNADGLLFLDEFTGPSRGDWNDRLLARARALYAEVPRAWRLHDSLPAPIDQDDPTEAVRSSVILPRLRLLFALVLERPYGGHFVSLILPQLDRSAIPPASLDALLSQWLALEDEDLRTAPAASYLTAVLARPRRGL